MGLIPYNVVYRNVGGTLSTYDHVYISQSVWTPGDAFQVYSKCCATLLTDISSLLLVTLLYEGQVCSNIYLTNYMIWNSP